MIVPGDLVGISVAGPALVMFPKPGHEQECPAAADPRLKLDERAIVLAIVRGPRALDGPRPPSLSIMVLVSGDCSKVGWLLFTGDDAHEQVTRHLRRL